MIDIIFFDQLTECLEFDCPWCKSLACALGNDTVRIPDKLLICIIRYIKLSYTMNINHGKIYGAIYCNFILTPMKYATILVLFEGYAPFPLVHLFESFPIPYFFGYLGFFPLLRLECISGGIRIWIWSWSWNWTFVAGLLVGFANRTTSKFLLLLLVLTTMKFLTTIHTYRFTSKCRIGNCCNMYHEASSPLWRHIFWQWKHSMRTACTVHTPNRNHCTWGGREILISTAAQLMESQTHIHISSPSLTNEEDNLKNQKHFIPLTL